jgi:hypothetical protein
MQFLHWLGMQDKTWLARLKEIEIENKGSEGGYSPCCLCCIDLIELRENDWDESDQTPSVLALPSTCRTSISWQTPYVSNEEVNRSIPCHRTTTQKSLNRMRSAGWRIDSALINQVQYAGKTSEETCDGI